LSSFVEIYKEALEDGLEDFGLSTTTQEGENDHVSDPTNELSDAAAPARSNHSLNPSAISVTTINTSVPIGDYNNTSTRLRPTSPLSETLQQSEPGETGHNAITIATKTNNQTAETGIISSVPPPSAVISFPKKNHSDVKFNYTAFWQRVMAQAMTSLEQNATEPNYTMTTCPKVFVYNLTKDLTEGKGGNTNLTKAFGDPDGILHKTHQNSFARIAEYRLRTSQYCFTTNPEEADLFFVPIFPLGHGVKQWERLCKDHARIMAALLPQLPYLTKETACRHFMIVGKGHYAASKCYGWWRRPVPELKKAMRVAYTDKHYKINKKLPQFYEDKRDTRDFPNLVSVPYPSALHWRRDRVAPWKDPTTGYNASSRESLMLFVGSARHGDVSVRRKVEEQCFSYHNLQKCNLSVNNNTKGKTRGLRLDTKLKSIFCLEPGGDTPDRKSISDSIAAGCIPVLFNDITGTGWQWFWDSWKARAHVVVPRKEFVAGKIDLFTLLYTTMPLELRDLMQDTLSIRARQFQYSIDEDPKDGIRVMLEGLKAKSQGNMNGGQCR